VTSDDELAEKIHLIIWSIISLIVMGYMLWSFRNVEPIKTYIDKNVVPTINWIVSTLILIGKVVLVAGVVVGVVYLVYAIHRRKVEAERRRMEQERQERIMEEMKKAQEERKRAEEEMRAKGYVKYVNIRGEEVWGSPEEAEKQNYLSQIIKAIREFEPPRRYDNERGYHDTLFAWLKSRFPMAKMEYQVGASRPDIVIEIGSISVAIEVKGPTGNQELQTIADKLLRYRRYFENVILVLFDVRVNPVRYREWLGGIEESFPDVVVIRKDVSKMPDLQVYEERRLVGEFRKLKSDE